MNTYPFKPKTVDQSGNRVIPNVSIEASLLVDAFKGMPAGHQIGYAELSAMIGRDIQHNFGYLSTARRILHREHGMLIETVKGVGVRVATESGKLAASRRDMQASRRAIRRAASKLEITEYEALTEDEKREFNARSSLIGGLSLLAAPAAMKRVEKELTGSALPSAATLELFKR